MDPSRARIYMSVRGPKTWVEKARNSWGPARGTFLACRSGSSTRVVPCGEECEGMWRHVEACGDTWRHVEACARFHGECFSIGRDDPG